MSAPSVTSLSCPGCLAPVAPVAGSATCTFCGTSLFVEGPGTGNETSVLPFTRTRDEVRRKVQGQLRGGLLTPGDFGADASAIEVSRLYIPAVFASANTTTRWSAEVGSTHKDGTVKWEPKSGTLKKAYQDECILAGEGPWSRAARDAGKKARSAVPLEPTHLQGATVLNVGGTKREQRAVASGIFEERQALEARKVVPGRLHRSISSSTSVEKVELEPVLLPLWGVSYTYGRRKITGYVVDETLKIHSTSGKPTDPIRVAALLGVAVGGMLFLFGTFTCCCGLGSVAEASELGPHAGPARLEADTSTRHGGVPEPRRGVRERQARRER